MILKLATSPELRHEAHRAVALLRDAGIPAEDVVADNGSSGNGQSPGRHVDGDIVPLLAVDASHVVAAVLKRDEPSDVLLARGVPNPTLRGLPPGTRVGMAGPRRRAFLRAHRPDLVPVSLENGHSPPEAFATGRIDAAIMSGAEARGAGLEGQVTEAQDPKGWLPGPQQGAVVVVVPNGEREAIRHALDHGPTRAAVACEGALADLLDAWDAPVGILAQPTGPWMRLWAMVASTDGSRVVRGDLTGRVDEPEAVAALMAEYLRARGADEVMAR